MSEIFRSSYGKLPAQDVERARAFYRDVLGFEPVREHRNHLFYECGGGLFLVFPSSGEPSGTHETTSRSGSESIGSKRTTRQSRERLSGSHQVPS